MIHGFFTWDAVFDGGKRAVADAVNELTKRLSS